MKNVVFELKTDSFTLQFVDFAAFLP